LRQSLQGTSLDNEIRFCLSNQQECRITTEYLARVYKLDSILDSLSSTASTVIEKFLRKEINPILSNKVLSDIYIPVRDCVDSL
jgi:glutamine synthetase adenylyltransferase